MKTFAEKTNTFAEPLMKLFDRYVEKTVTYMKKNCKFIIPVSYFSMTASLCRMFEGIIGKYRAHII